MATISFTTNFDLTLSPKRFAFIDTSDYAGQSIATSNVNGCFQIIAPSGGLIYDNTDYTDGGCDIKVSTSTSNQTVIALPITSDSLVEQGTYTILYTVYDNNLLVYSTKTVTVDYEYIAPVVEIDFIVNIIGQLFSQTDSTNYVVGGVTPTISRVNKLIYPQGVQGGPPAPLVTTAATLKTNWFYNGPQTATVTSDVVYTFTGFTVTDQLYGTKWVNVDGAYFCSIMCGLNAYQKKAFSCTTSELRKQYVANYTLACSLLANTMGNIDCNGGSQISPLLDEIKEIIGECGCGCGCDEDEDDYSRVTGWATLIGIDGTDGTNGINGINGTNGIDGAAILINATSGSGTASVIGTWTDLLTGTVAAGELATDGSVLEVCSWVVKSVSSSTASLEVKIQGVSMFSVALNPGVKSTKLKSTLTRVDATTGFYEVEITSYADNDYFLAAGSSKVILSPTSITFANSAVVDVRARLNAGTGNITAKQLMVTLLTK